MLNRPRLLVSAAILPLLLMACNPGGLTDPSGTSVSVLFRGAGAPATAALQTSDTGTLPLEGSNGTLEITAIRAIVSELELDCDDDAGSACAEFERGPAFVTVPLGATEVEIADAAVPPGRYDEFEFEIEDLDADDDDLDAKTAAMTALLDEVRVGYPDFPSDASMIVEGSFTPTDGETRTFLTYVDAEVEIELPLVPPLEVAEGDGPVIVPVTIDPSVWFTLPDGTVFDLSAFDHATTGEIPEIEVDIEGSFDIEVVVDDD